MKRIICSAAIVGLATVSAECPNGCNGHGKCTSYDMCICNRNWQANDCSERVCQFGLAHVDTPKGDLDMNHEISGPDLTVAENSFTFPYGTSEQFPQARDSDLREVTNSAHYYMECSNKGTCNRETGECECFDGYDGSACQRASCPGYPNSCSGHGVCKSIRQLARADNNNIYELWDRHATMGCECDDGFYGPDCSLRKCKHGIDPLYYDDSTTIKYATWDFAILTDASSQDFYNGMIDEDTAYFAIRVFDMHGEDWVTEPIAYGATCPDVVAAIEAIPNEVIKAGTLSCYKKAVTNVDPLLTGNIWSTGTDSLHAHSRTIKYPMAFWEFNTRSSALVGSSAATASGTVYRIRFGGTPGALREPQIEKYLDGTRPSIASHGTLVTAVWTDGQQGESVDYFADYCAGVTVTLTTSGGSVVLGGMSQNEQKLLKACLGGSDFDVVNNQDIYDWDYGTDNYPHLVKLVLTTTDTSDGGYYVALKFDGSNFVLYNQFELTGTSTDQFDVYTTKGVLARTSSNAAATFGFGSHEIRINDAAAATQLKSDISCEINDNNAAKTQYWTRNTPASQTTCLNKTNIFTILSTTVTNNPSHINLYRVNKIYQKEYSVDGASNVWANTYVINSDLATNFATSSSATTYFVYKFFPSSDSTYTYVAECANRGICNTDSGLCECFGGYTSDDCSQQNSLAV